MFEIYRKCEKSEDNIYGIEKIDNYQNINYPFLLCLSSREDDLNSVFGIIKEGARAARIRTSDEYAGGFKINEMKVLFLGVKNNADSFNKELTSLTEDFIYPNLIKNNNLRKNARMMNFFTYCNATKVYVQIEKKLEEKLYKDGYSKNEIKEILSQISLVSIASQIDISNIYATSVLFKDVNDFDVYDYYSKLASKKMEEMNRNTFISKIKSDGNNLAFLFNGMGHHELKYYFENDGLVKAALSSVVSKLIENSYINYKSDDFFEISSKYILPTLIRNNPEFNSNKELLDKLDESLKYYASKYTKEEDETLKEEEIKYKSLINQTDEEKGLSR